MHPRPSETKVNEANAGNITSRTNEDSRTNETTEISARSNFPERPKLSAPPRKPVSPTAATSQLSQADRPILKRDQVNQTPNKSSEEIIADKVEKPARRNPIGARSESAPPKAKPVLELHRPKPARSNQPIELIGSSRSSAVETPDSTAEDEADGAAVLLDSEELKRPALPRPVKAGGGKKWQEEEIDEGQDSAGKLGKGGVKVKRLKPLVELDEEEDFDDEQVDIDAPIQVSLSVARPPKQKALMTRPGQSSPAAATSIGTAVKSRKSGGLRENNRRREPEQNASAQKS